mgnify:FL=1
MDLLDVFGLKGKNVLVTGAGSGMGKAAARLLTELGANVYATVRRKPVDFAVTKQIPCDLGSKEGVDAMLAQLPDALEAIYICHGISNTQGNSNAMQVQLTNFFSFKYIAEQLLPRIADNGSVTFISSEIDEMLRVCSRLVVMRDRQVVGELRGSDLNQSSIMKTIAGGEQA